jgi:hypothetical protein
MEKYRELGDLRIAREEEGFLRIIAPLHYADSVIGGKLGAVDGKFLVEIMQDELHEILQAFLNGGLSKRSYATFPMLQLPSEELRIKIQRVRSISSAISEKGKGYPNNAAPFTIESCAQAISWHYQVLSRLMGKGGKSALKGKCEALDMESYKEEDHLFLSPLEEMQRISGLMGKEGCRLYLHGSLATKDYIKGWSDCDLLCVVSKEAIGNPKRLLSLRKKLIEVRRHCCRVDPLQHHGTMALTEYDFDSYPQPYFPIQLFKFAKSFGEDRVRKIRLRDHKVEAYAKLFWFVSYFRRMARQGSLDAGSYETKNLLHLMALFPSLYLQAKGVFVYKKHSFGMVQKEFSKELWRPIDEMTRVRGEWAPLPANPGIEGLAAVNPFAAYQLNAKIIDLRGSMKNMNIDAKLLCEGMHLLSEEAWKRSLKRL